jgi:RimJ/RimL family protein N-acetyltransferase
MLNLKLATQNNLNTISQLANEIWNEHYIPIIGKEQVDYMLTKMYNLESLKTQMFTQHHRFYLVENETEPIGFITISSENNEDFFLHKFYIKQSLSNKGIGSEILEKIIKLAFPKTLTLTVNRQNFKSINFYFKNGFKIDHVADFDIGNGFVMNDFVMKKHIR